MDLDKTPLLFGDWWKALEIEFTFPSPSLVTAVRTDSPPELPAAVWCKDEGGVWVRARVGGGGSFAGGVVELDPPALCGAVRVRWEDTDLHKTCLSTARSGGGLHAEIIGRVVIKSTYFPR